MISPIKLGWVAGVIDLKGRLIFKHNQQRATPQVVLMVESKEMPVIRELNNLTGTRSEARDRRPLKNFMRKGCTEHCPEAHIHIHEELEGLYLPAIARWTVTGAGMYVVLDNVLPYIQIDRGYTEAMAQVMENTALDGQGSGAVVSSLRRLHGLGWELPREFKEAVTDAAT